MSLILHLGPMYSGKSTELIRQVLIESIVNTKFLIINSELDERYTKDNFVYSHSHDKYTCLSVKMLSDIDDNIIEGVSKIYIEESHFFDDLSENVLKWVALGKHVNIFGLNGDYARKPFPEINALISHADDIKMYKSKCEICKDGTDAIFSLRLGDSKDKILVGTKKDYIPVCRTCYQKNNKS